MITENDKAINWCEKMHVMLNIHYNVLPKEEYISFKNHLVEYEQCAAQELFNDQDWLNEQKRGIWKPVDTRYGSDSIMGKLSELYLSCAINKVPEYNYLSQNSKEDQTNNIDGILYKKNWRPQGFSVQVKTGHIRNNTTNVKRKWFNRDFSNLTDRLAIVDFFDEQDGPKIITVSGDRVIQPFMEQMDRENVDVKKMNLPSDITKVQWWGHYLQHL